MTTPQPRARRPSPGVRRARRPGRRVLAGAGVFVACVRRSLAPSVVVSVALVPLVVLATTGAAGASPTLQSTGASFVGPAMQQWVAQAGESLGLNVNWEVTSSVIGLDDFALNEVDFGASDIPYSSGQAANYPTVPFQYMPDVAGALAFMYNLVGQDGQPIDDLVLDARALDAIFTGEITRWNNPVIAKLNPQLAGDLPNTTITPVYRTDASGDNYLFSDYLIHQDPGDFIAYENAIHFSNPGQPSAIWPTPQGGEPIPPQYPNWEDNTPIGANGADNAADDVAAASSNGYIGFAETAYAIEHNIPVASIVNASGNAVQPTSRNDAVALEKAILYSDLSQNLTYVYTNPLPDAYPVSSYSYLVTQCSPALAQAQGAACAGNNSKTPTFPADKGATLGQFVKFIACAGQQQMASLGYSPLPPNLVQEDFNAIGRLVGAHQPPPVSPADCPNPYVDGQIPLPGEPAIIGGAGTAAGANPGAVGPGVPGAGGTGGSAADSGGSSSGSATSLAGRTSVSVSGVGTTTSTSSALCGDKFSCADLLASAASATGRLSVPMIVAWALVVAVVLAVPPVAVWWARRRRASMGPVPVRASDAADKSTAREPT